MNIFPNPFTDKIDLQLKGSAARQIEVSILSPGGAILRKENRQVLNGSLVNISGLQSFTPGIYYILAKDEQGNILYSGRVAKNN